MIWPKLKLRYLHLVATSIVGFRYVGAWTGGGWWNWSSILWLTFWLHVIRSPCSFKRLAVKKQQCKNHRHLDNVEEGFQPHFFFMLSYVFFQIYVFFYELPDVCFVKWSWLVFIDKIERWNLVFFIDRFMFFHLGEMGTGAFILKLAPRIWGQRYQIGRCEMCFKDTRHEGKTLRP